MSAKTVALDSEAYAMLRRQRRSGETFSQTVKRLTGKRRSILEFSGIWRDVPAEDMRTFRSSLTEGRRRDRARLERLFGRDP